MHSRNSINTSLNSNYRMNLNRKPRTNPPKPTNQIHNSLAELRNQFIHHCAVLIQSRFRAYLQRKRYRQFLPIYRRFRELLLAISDGWRTRKILKLPSIKTQIASVREKTSKNQVNLARMGKRELIDEIQRLKRKGRWVEEYRRTRMLKRKILSQESKENCSLFGNVKAVSIRNVFRQDLGTKKGVKAKEQTKGNVKKQDSKQKDMQQMSQLQSNFEAQTTKQESFEERAITPKQNFYSLLQQKLKQQKQAFPQPKPSKYLKQPAKPANKVTRNQPTEENTQQAQSSNQKQASVRNKQQTQSKKQSPKIPLLNLNPAQLKKANEPRQSMQSNRSTNRPKKLKLTLTKKSLQTQQLTSQRQANSQSELSFLTHSQHSLLTSRCREEDFESLEQSLLLAYRQKYLKRGMSRRKKSDLPSGSLPDPFLPVPSPRVKGYYL